MKHISLIFKGMLFGIANLIPGVSGGTMAVVTGVYEKLLDSINNLFKKFKSSFLFLLLFGLGAIAAILGGAKIIDWGLQYFELPISLLFIGLILGSLPAITRPIKKKMKFYHYLILIVSFVAVISLLYVPFPEVVNSDLKVYDYLLLVLCGFFASVAMVVPGVSGMMMFYLFGYYETIMGAISGLLKVSTLGGSILVLICVGIGIVIGLFSAAKVIATLLEKFPIATYVAILGFVIASIFVLMYQGGLMDEFVNMTQYSSIAGYFTYATLDVGSNVFYMWAIWTIAVILFAAGIFGSLLLIQLSDNKENEKKETERLITEKREKMRQELIEEINNTNKPSGGKND